MSHYEKTTMPNQTFSCGCKSYNGKFTYLCDIHRMNLLYELRQAEMEG